MGLDLVHGKPRIQGVQKRVGGLLTLSESERFWGDNWGGESDQIQWLWTF